MGWPFGEFAFNCTLEREVPSSEGQAETTEESAVRFTLKGVKLEDLTADHFKFTKAPEPEPAR